MHYMRYCFYVDPPYTLIEHVLLLFSVMDMMTEALQMTKDSKTTFWAQILSVGDITSYKIRTGSEIRYFKLVVP